MKTFGNEIYYRHLHGLEEVLRAFNTLNPAERIRQLNEGNVRYFFHFFPELKVELMDVCSFVYCMIYYVVSISVKLCIHDLQRLNFQHWVLCHDVKTFLLHYTALTSSLFVIQDINLQKSWLAAESAYIIPTTAGLPLNLSVTASIALDVHASGNIDIFSIFQTGHAGIRGRLKPRYVAGGRRGRWLTLRFNDHPGRWFDK